MAVTESPAGRFFTLAQHREIWARTAHLPRRGPERATELTLLARAWGRTYEAVLEAGNLQLRRFYKWTPAEWAYVRGEVERVEDWVDPEKPPLLPEMFAIVPGESVPECIEGRLRAVEAKVDEILEIVRAFK